MLFIRDSVTNAIFKSFLTHPNLTPLFLFHVYCRKTAEKIIQRNDGDGKDTASIRAVSQSYNVQLEIPRCPRHLSDDNYEITHQYVGRDYKDLK